MSIASLPISGKVCFSWGKVKLNVYVHVMWIEVDDRCIMKSQWVCSCTCFLLRNGHVWVQAKQKYEEFRWERCCLTLKPWLSQFFLQKKYVHPAFLQPPHLVQPPGGCRRGTGPACAGEEAKEFWNTQREGGCRMFMVQVTRRWVNCLWKMSPLWLDYASLVHRFFGPSIPWCTSFFWESLFWGILPKPQNAVKPMGTFWKCQDELTKFPTSFSSGELYSWVCGQWSLLVGSSFRWT
jgi:hypothetical protein